MKLAKVSGTITATRKEGIPNGLRILVVSYLDEELRETGNTGACVDTVNAGSGDVVLLCSSSSARMTELTRGAASDNTIIGIVDSISTGRDMIYSKNQAEQQKK